MEFALLKPLQQPIKYSLFLILLLQLPIEHLQTATQ